MVTDQVSNNFFKIFSKVKVIFKRRNSFIYYFIPEQFIIRLEKVLNTNVLLYDKRRCPYNLWRDVNRKPCKHDNNFCLGNATIEVLGYLLSFSTYGTN